MVKEKYSIKNVIHNFISSHKWILVAYGFLMIAFPLELVVQPHFYGKIIDGVSKSKPSKIIDNNKHIIMILIGLWLTNQVLYASLDTLDSFVIPKVQSYVRTNLVNDIINTFKNSYEELEIWLYHFKSSKITSYYQRYPASNKEFLFTNNYYIGCCSNLFLLYK